jgi:cysteine-rich repeat protein
VDPEALQEGDRGYLPAAEVQQLRHDGTAVHCKAFPLNNAGRYTKADFQLDCRLGLRCGDGVLQPESGEQCDDGNTVSGDGCSDTCRIEVT